jgi:hypothetical protein
MSQEYHRNESRFHGDRLKNPIKTNLRRIGEQRFFKFAFDAQFLPTPHRERETHTQSGFAAQRVGGPTWAHPARPAGSISGPCSFGVMKCVEERVVR